MKKNLTLISAAILTAMLAFAGCNGAPAENSNTAKSSDGSATENTTENSTSASGEDTQLDPILEAAYKAREENNVTKLIQFQKPEAGETVATLHTNMGDIKLRFFPQYAPLAVENFLTHAKEGYYDGVTFHRVINEFMIQGGDPEGTGRGGESIWGSVFPNEVTWNLKSYRGALCMANAGPNTNGSQFYIVQNDSVADDQKTIFEQFRSMGDEVYYQSKETGAAITYADVYPDEAVDAYLQYGGVPSLDMSYTIFGQAYEGMDVVDAIAAVETDSSDKPLEDVIINSIDVYEYKGDGAAAPETQAEDAQTEATTAAQ